MCLAFRRPTRIIIQATDEVRGTLASIGLVELATDNLYRKVLAVRETYASQARVPPNASTMDKLNDIQRYAGYILLGE